MEFTTREIKDLTISVIVLALAFSGFAFEALPVVALVIVAVFVTHELGHKFFAQKYGCTAHYKKWTAGLFLAIVMALLPGGFVFAAPGAVYISPFNKSKFAFSIANITKREYGIIAAAGPAVNLVVAGLALAVNALYPFMILSLIAKISIFLALFNLLPFGPLDGNKILNWDKKVWGALTAVAFLSFMLLSI